MKKICLFSFFLVGISIISLEASMQAFCNVPVADLFFEIPDSINKELGYTQPWDEHNTPPVYPRASQLLFNERVSIIKYENDYALVDINHWFFANSAHDHYRRYWIKKDVLTTLENNNAKVPQPISFDTKRLYYSNVATLTEPYTINGVRYSAGTRFSVAPTQNTSKLVSIFIYNPEINTFSIEQVPTEYMLHQKFHSSKEKRTFFLSLLRKWTTQEKHFPYVFGGASLIDTFLPNETFSSRTYNVKGKNATFFYRTVQTSSIPAGIDCSQLIARTAQLAQIPIFAKNTSTFLKIYEGIKEDYQLQDGDFIVWRGHCIVISSLAENTVIEARGYPSGYGQVHELPLSAIFKNVTTYAQLKEKYLKKEPLERLNKSSEVTQIIKDFKIVSLI